MLGGEVSSTSVKRVIAHAVVERRAERWILRMVTKVGEAAGRRTLEGQSCRELADAAALIVALAYDPDAVARTAAQAEVPEVVPLPHVLPELPTDDAPPATLAAPSIAPPFAPEAPPAAKSPEVGGAAGLAASFDLGTLPSPAFGLTALLGLKVWRVRFDWTGTLWLAQSEVPEDTVVGGEFSYLSTALAACPLLLEDPLELGLCAGIEVGRLYAKALGVDNFDTCAVLWTAHAGLLGAWKAADWLALRLDLGAAVPVERPEWGLSPVGPVDQPGAGVGRARLAVETRF